MIPGSWLIDPREKKLPDMSLDFLSIRFVFVGKRDGTRIEKRTEFGKTYLTFLDCISLCDKILRFRP